MGRCFSRLAAKFAFFPPDPPTYRIKEEREGKVVVSGVPRDRFMDVHLLNTKHGSKIVAFYLKNPYARLTLLYSHGNAADLGQLYDLFAQLKLSLRVNVMGYDYSGYGASTGKPSERHTYADIEAVYECLETHYGISQENIILYGQSVGSGPTLHLAAKLPRLRGVVLHSAILSGIRVLCHADVSFCFDIFKNNKKIKKVKCPVLVIHGTDDDVVNLFHGNGLYKMAREPYEPLWIKGGGHCNLELYPDFISHLTRFIFEMERVNTATHLKKMRLAYLASPHTTPDKCCCNELTCECGQCFTSCTETTCCKFNFDCFNCFNCWKNLKGLKCLKCFNCFKSFEGFNCSRCFKGPNCFKNVECFNSCFKCNHCCKCFESFNCFKCFESFKCFRCFDSFDKCFDYFEGFKCFRCFQCFKNFKCSDCL